MNTHCPSLVSGIQHLKISSNAHNYAVYYEKKKKKILQIALSNVFSVLWNVYVCFNKNLLIKPIFYAISNNQKYATDVCMFSQSPISPKGKCQNFNMPKQFKQFSIYFSVFFFFFESSTILKRQHILYFCNKFIAICQQQMLLVSWWVVQMKWNEEKKKEEEKNIPSLKYFSLSCKYSPRKKKTIGTLILQRATVVYKSNKKKGWSRRGLVGSVLAY